MIDFLLDDEDDLIILPDGEVAFGQSEGQEVYLNLRLVEGDLRHEPFSGVNLQQYIRTNINANKLTAIIERKLRADAFTRIKVSYSPFNVQASR